MLKKTFIRLMLLGGVAFASCFVFISTSHVQVAVNPDCNVTDTQDDTRAAEEGFILETMLGKVLTGIN